MKTTAAFLILCTAAVAAPIQTVTTMHDTIPLYGTQSDSPLPTFSLPAVAADKAYGDWPMGVNTNQQLIQMGTPIFGADVPASAFQSDEFGPFYANEVK